VSSVVSVMSGDHVPHSAPPNVATMDTDVPNTMVPHAAAAAAIIPIHHGTLDIGGYGDELHHHPSTPKEQPRHSSSLAKGLHNLESVLQGRTGSGNGGGKFVRLKEEEEEEGDAEAGDAVPMSLHKERKGIINGDHNDGGNEGEGETPLDEEAPDDPEHNSDDDEEELGDPVPRDVLVAKAVYFFLSGAFSCVTPFLTIFFESMGFSHSQTGLLFSIQPFLGFFGGSLGTLLADKTRKYKLVLVSGLTLTSFLRLALFGVHDFWPMLAVVFATETVSSPIYPLLDNAVLEVLRSQTQSYGKIRLWGAVGWGIFAALMGWIITFTGLHAAFVGFGVLAAITILLLTFLPMGRPRLHDEIHHQQRLRERREDSTVLTLLRLFSSFEVAAFFVTVFCLGFCMGAILTVLFIFLQSLGADEIVMGLSITFTCIAEVPFFFFFQRLVKVIGVRGILYLSFVCYVIRLIYYSFLQNPWLVLPAELLHGITYAAAWSACVLHAKSLAPRGLEATMQGLLTGTHWGIGVGVGALVGGVLLENFGAVDTFRITAGFAVCGMLIFFFSNLIIDFRGRRSKNENGK